VAVLFKVFQPKDGQPVKVAGLVLVRQRPGTARKIAFLLRLEEEVKSYLSNF
jgi:hypothetical protein